MNKSKLRKRKEDGLGSLTNQQKKQQSSKLGNQKENSKDFL
jgi:hypothetical protein